MFKRLLLVSASLALFAVISISVVYLFYVRKQESSPLTQEIRETADGDFIKLSKGIVRYKVYNPNSQETILLLTGAGSGFEVWEKCATVLAENGYKVITFDFYGRGYSDRVEEPYTSSLFLTQMEEIIDSLHLPANFTLAGFSMGGIIAIDYALKSPDRLKSLVLINPAALNVASKWYFNLPLISDMLTTIYWMPRAVDKQMEEFHTSSASTLEYRSIVEQQCKIAGYKSAMLSIWRHTLTENREKEMKKLQDNNIPVLLVWSKNDTRTPVQQSEIYIRNIPKARLSILDNCGHPAPYEKATETAEEIVQFLKR